DHPRPLGRAGHLELDLGHPGDLREAVQPRELTSAGAARLRRYSTPAPGVSKIWKTRSRSVISKILRMFGSWHEIASSPPTGRSRLTAPIITPRVVESMNVALDRSTSTP